MSVDVRLVEVPRDRGGLSRFLRVPYAVYRGDPHWVAPILKDRALVLGDDNPFWGHARVAFWVARSAGRDVGSIAGIVDEHHNSRHGEQTAFFGFFESLNDPAVSRLLFAAVRSWASHLGMKRLLGVVPPHDGLGCLQDIHWYYGAWGYFPTYTLGAMAAAQLYEAAERAIADLAGAIGRGDFAPLYGWLGANVHGQASFASTDEILAAATGAPLSAAAWKAHIERRYLAG